MSEQEKQEILNEIEAIKQVMQVHVDYEILKGKHFDKYIDDLLDIINNLKRKLKE